MTTPSAETDGAERPDPSAPSTTLAGWQRFAFPAIWLLYLASVVRAVHEYSSGVAAVVGYAVLGAFGVVYTLAVPAGWTGRTRRFWRLYVAGCALTVLEAFFAHQAALAFLVFLAVLTVAARRRWSLGAVLAMAVLAWALPAVIPGWGGRLNWNDGLTVLLVSFAMFGFFEITRSNRALAAARAEVARLAAEGERSRIARDLHDLLGHSLTTITVKAGLARRLAERGDPRALAEITEVETLSRRTLGDVRAAVAGHHEVTLAGELATAREVLRAAGISAELPGSVDGVDPSLSETFGWVVREGVTNLVRHSRAPACRILLGSRWIEITDNGGGAAGGGGGSGLRGLRERLAAVGGTVTTSASLSGFRLRAEVPAAGDTDTDTNTDTDTDTGDLTGDSDGTAPEPAGGRAAVPTVDGAAR